MASVRAQVLAHRPVAVRVVGNSLSVACFVMAVAVIVSLLLWAGFEHTTSVMAKLKVLLHWAQALFTTSIVFNFLTSHKGTLRRKKMIRWLADIAILLLLIPEIYPHPVHPWLPWLEKVLYSTTFMAGILAAYSVFEISYGVMLVVGRRVNPSILLGGSFLILITIGAFLLMMPRCTVSGISFTNALFVSGSAVCITGLTPVDISATFTPLGQTIIAILFELGALGIITFTSFFALFFSGSQSIYSQLLMKDIIYSKTINALIPTLLYILGFTLSIEIIGAFAIYFTLPDTLFPGIEDKIQFAVFQSMSSFCNVGFTNVADGLSNPAFMKGNQSIYIVVSALVIAGGIGFPLLVNFKDTLALKIRKLWSTIFHSERPQERVHTLDLNTKVVLFTTVTIFVLGAASFFLLESGNTMKGMTLYQRIVQSVFNATTPRSSGFASVNPANFLNVTLIIVMVQMWIGGASQSMAGGVKVNTIGAILLNLRSVVLGRQNITAFKRNIAIPSVRRANAIVTLSIISTVIFVVTVMLLEPNLSAKDCVFEVVSALFTVGTSLGATPHLGEPAKYVLIAAMFLGRVGLLSLMSGFFSPKHDSSMHFPSENVIIN